MSIFDFFSKSQKPSTLDQQLIDNQLELEKALAPYAKEAPEGEGKRINAMDVSNIYLLDDANSGAESKGGVDYDQLKAMSRIPLIASIINTRANQVAEFATPCFEGDSIGFHIRLKDRNRTATDEERQTINDIYNFMVTCGDPRLDFEANFEGFLRMLVRDSLIYDSCTFEVVRDRAKRVAGFSALDASTIRRAKLTEKEREAGKRDIDGVHYVQVMNNKVTAEFGVKDLCFGIRRPRSDVRFRGYGFPELEESVGLLTSLLNAENFNSANFTNGISVSGIVAVKTKMNPQLFRAFRREFYQMLSGSHNAKRTPLIQLDPDSNEDLKSLNLSASNKEMEFQEWVYYLIKQICALWQIDPAEIGFAFGNTGVKSSLSQSGPTESILLSREKGLRPLLRAIQFWLNKYIINELDERFELVFTGLDGEDPKEKLKMDIDKVKAFMTINEARALHDLPPIDGGDVILDAAFINSGLKAVAPGGNNDE